MESGGKTWTVRTEATGAIPALMRFAGITLPAHLRATSPPPEVAAPPRTPPKLNLDTYGGGFTARALIFLTFWLISV